MVIFLKTDFIDINCSYILDCRATQTQTHTEISVETTGGSGCGSSGDQDRKVFSWCHHRCRE